MLESLGPTEVMEKSMVIIAGFLQDMDCWFPNLGGGRVVCLFPTLCSVATDDGLWRYFFWEAPKCLKRLEMGQAVCSSSVTPLLMLHGLSGHGESL